VEELDESTIDGTPLFAEREEVPTRALHGHGRILRAKRAFAARHGGQNGGGRQGLLTNEELGRERTPRDAGQKRFRTSRVIIDKAGGRVGYAY
jgi:hypothetical protein